MSPIETKNKQPHGTIIYTKSIYECIDHTPFGPKNNSGCEETLGEFGKVSFV